jgi:hypothetical protein
MPKFDVATTEALADAWASIDGHLDAFRKGKGKPWEEQPGGRYDGYMADAESMLERLLTRGFILSPTGIPVGRVDRD